MGFEKGKSGNPGGRPRKSQQQIDYEEKCRNWSALYAFDKIKKWADSGVFEQEKWAITELHDHGFGKAVQSSVIEAHVTSETGATAQEIADSLTDIIGAPAVEGGGCVGPNKVDAGA